MKCYQKQPWLWLTSNYLLRSSRYKAFHGPPLSSSPLKQGLVSKGFNISQSWRRCQSLGCGFCISVKLPAGVAPGKNASILHPVFVPHYGTSRGSWEGRDRFPWVVVVVVVQIFQKSSYSTSDMSVKRQISAVICTRNNYLVSMSLINVDWCFWLSGSAHSRSLISSSRWVCGCRTCLLMEHWIELNSSDVWPSMVTHTQNLCSSFNPSKCTHTVVNTHTANTHPEQWGVWCLDQGSHLSRGIEGGENARYSLPPPTIPAGPEIRTHNLGSQVQRSIH